MFQKEVNMSGLNHKGPTGQGPMTGRRIGRCTNSGAILKNQPESGTGNETNFTPEDFIRKGFGMGRGERGFDRGIGRQNRFRAGQ